MGYDVRIVPAAIQDLDDYYRHISADSKSRAGDWLNGAWKAILALSEMPKRYAVIEESEAIGVELRDIPYHSHRIVFRVDEEALVVEVLRVFPMARESFKRTDVPSDPV